MNSDQLVEAMQPYGAVIIHQDGSDKTFYAKIELKVTGMDASVRTGFGEHKTMLDALSALKQKLDAVVITMGSISKETPLLEG